MLLQLVGIGATCAVDTPLPLVHNACVVSQAHSKHSVLDHFHYFASVMPGEMGNADLSHIPTDKSFLRLISRFFEHRMMNPQQTDAYLHSYIDCFSDPVQYYVYGLRKIVV